MTERVRMQLEAAVGAHGGAEAVCLETAGGGGGRAGLGACDVPAEPVSRRGDVGSSRETGPFCWTADGASN